MSAAEGHTLPGLCGKSGQASGAKVRDTAYQAEEIQLGLDAHPGPASEERINGVSFSPLELSRTPSAWASPVINESNRHVSAPTRRARSPPLEYEKHDIVQASVEIKPEDGAEQGRACRTEATSSASVKPQFSSSDIEREEYMTLLRPSPLPPDHMPALSNY